MCVCVFILKEMGVNVKCACALYNLTQQLTVPGER